jgi:anti-anti-sigma regulatory factor
LRKLDGGGLYHRMTTPHYGEHVSTLHAVVAAATSSQERSLTISLDELPKLDDKAIKNVVVALRRMRDARGTLRLHVTRKDILAELRATGLDRVFQIVAA